MDCDGIAKSLVRVPHEAEDLAGIFQGHLNNVVQDKLLLIWPALRLGPGEVDHDVLPPCVFRTIEKGHRGVREIPIMTLEQQLLGPVPDLQSRAQDKITWLPGFHKAFPPEATRKHISYFLTLDLIRLQADSLFQGLEKGFNTRNKVLTAKLLRQGYRYHKLRKAFSKFYRRHFDIVSKYNVGLKTLLLQGLSEPEFYGDLVYKFRKIIGKIDFPYHFKKIIVRYKKIGYNINVMRQTACLVVNPIKVNSFAYLFNCTTVGRTSD